MARRPAARAPLDPAVRARLTAEFRQRWARAGYPTLVQHILGNMSQAHGVPLGVLKDIARSVRAEHEHDQAGRPASPPPRPVDALAPLAIVDGANLAWARTADDGHPRLDNLALVRTALGERGYQALIVVDAALRHQLGRHDASELERQIQAQAVIQAPAATDADRWVLTIADHHGAPVVSNDRFDEYGADFPWIGERRVAVVFVDHAALLQGAALDGRGRPPASPAALREELEQLRRVAAAAQARAEDEAALRGRLTRLDGLLAREQGRSAELQAEVVRLTEQLAQERRAVDTLRHELGQHPEHLAKLSRELAEAQEEAAMLRGQRDGLQARVQDLERQVQQLGQRRPEERGAAATRADLEALRGELRGEIRDLGRVVRDVQSPLPRVLAMTREVREGLQAVRQAQGQQGETLQRLEQAARSLLLTTDYLATLAEEDEAEDEEDNEEDEDDEQEDLDGGVEGGDVAEAGDRVAAAADELTATEAAAVVADAADGQAAFARIEDAWLEGRTVGDLHERLNFLHLVVDVRMETREPAAIVAAFDRFRARAGGERFSYCPLHSAVHLVRARKPSLDNPLVLVRYRELLRLPPCASVGSCPGIADSISDILGGRP